MNVATITLLATTILCIRLLDGSLQCNQPLPENSVCVEVVGAPHVLMCEPPEQLFSPPHGVRYATLHDRGGGNHVH